MNENEFGELYFEVEEVLAQGDPSRYVKEGDVEDVISALYSLGYEVRKLSD